MANEIKVPITGDASGLEAAAKDSQKAIGGIEKSADSLNDSLLEVGKVAGLAFGSLVAAAAASVAAFRESEKATQNLEIALNNAGLSSGKLVKSYRDQASAVQDLTGIDDDAIVAAQAKLQTYLGQVEITQELTNALVDLSTETGSLEGAAEQLGKAYLGNTAAFKKQKIQIDENATAEERLAQAVEGVNARIGGRAAALSQGLGVLTKLGAAVSDLSEEFGKRLAPFVEKGAGALLKFIQAVRDNKPLLDFITNLGITVGVIAGIITAAVGVSLAIGGIGTAIGAVIPIIKALGLTVKAATLSTGIGALLLVIPLIITYFDELKAIATGTLVTLAKAFTSFGAILDGAFSGNFKKVRDEFENLKASLGEGIKAGQIEFAKSKGPEVEAGKDPNEAQLAAAKKSKELLQEEAAFKKQITAKQIEVATLQAQQGSDELIKIKQQEIEILNELLKDQDSKTEEALRARLASTQKLEKEATQNAADDKAILNDEILAKNAEYQAMDLAQREVFLAQNQQALQASVDNDRDVRNKATLTIIQDQVRANNQYLANQQQFGTAYAEINKFIYSAQVQAAAKGFSELTQLQQSNNAALKSIGKAAAVADITIKTAQSAMNIYTAFSTIPFIGPALGVAGAAAAIAFGGEQIGKVLSAQEGGIVPGINRGFDSTPAMLQPGELVVPRQNFDQVVQSVAAQRQSLDADQAPQTGPAPTQSGMIQIGFDGPEAEKVLTARRVEARSLGTLRDSQA